MSTLFKGLDRKLLGKMINIGNKLSFKSVDIDLNEVSFEKLGKVTIFSIFPSINTKVCDLQTSSMNKMALLFPNFDFIAMSLDLPTALNEWCGSHGIKNIRAFSDYKDREFGLKTGFLMDEVFLLNRGVIVLDENSSVIYIARNKDVHQQIDFKALQSFLEKISKKNI